MIIQIRPYNAGSQGAKALKDYLTANGPRAIISTRRANNKRRFYVGWGGVSFGFQPNGLVLNEADNTRVLSCKKRFFNAVRAEAAQYIPAFTTDPEVARSWNDTVVCRATTTGNSGEGITIVEAGGDLPRVPLYTRYQKKTKEYRLHVFNVNGNWEVRYVQQKMFVATPERAEPANWQVRNHANGFTFQTVPEAPEAVVRAAVEVMKSFPKIDFVALDIVYHKPTDVALVLEGNTAPGLEGPRVNVYGDFVIERFRNARGR